MGDFKDLKVWQRSRDLVQTMYRATAAFPETEMEGLALQLRRATVSIASNIAESRGRFTATDQVHFLRMALGSAREVECQAMIARDLGFIQPETAMKLLESVEEVERMLSALARSTRAHTKSR